MTVALLGIVGATACTRATDECTAADTEQHTSPGANQAASTTLPLGTTAKVTNLDTGQSADVTIQDRGPYVKGRIIHGDRLAPSAMGST